MTVAPTTLSGSATVAAAALTGVAELPTTVGPKLITGNAAGAGLQRESKASAFVVDEDVAAGVFTGVVTILDALLETVAATVVVMGTRLTTLLQLEGTAEASLSLTFATWAVFLLPSADDAGSGEALLRVGDEEARLEGSEVGRELKEDKLGTDTAGDEVRVGRAVTVATLARGMGRLTREVLV